jgi:hypothetical protein
MQGSEICNEGQVCPSTCFDSIPAKPICWKVIFNILSRILGHPKLQSLKFWETWTCEMGAGTAIDCGLQNIYKKHINHNKCTDFVNILSKVTLATNVSFLRKSIRWNMNSECEAANNVRGSSVHSSSDCTFTGIISFKWPHLWSWLQIRRPGFDSWHYQEKKIVVLERGPLSLVSTTEELLDRKVAAPV